MADNNGNLLFYSNGSTVWNKNHAVMATGIGGNPYANQSCIVVQKNALQHYIFTTALQSNGYLGYSIVDMSLAAGLGSVTGSYSLTANAAQMLTATQHCNGTDMWVLCHRTGSNQFDAYVANSVSVNPVPVVSNIGPAITTSNSAGGSHKFSPDGSKLALAYTYTYGPNTNSNAVILFDFNNSTGQVSNARTLTLPIGYVCVYVEISPDDSKLYAEIESANDNIIVQWDLCAGTTSAIAASMTNLVTTPFVNDTYGALGNAINGKIYFTVFDNNANKTELGCINSPNLPGLACNTISTAIVATSPTVVGSGIPNYPTHLFRAKPTFTPSPIVTGSNCGNISFSPTSTVCTTAKAPPTSRKWIFGDPGSGQLDTSLVANPTHSFTANGAYTVKMISYYNCYSDTAVTTVTVNHLPALAVKTKTPACKGAAVVFTLSGASSYVFNGTATNQQTVVMQPTISSTYTIVGSDAAGCQSKMTYSLTISPCNGVGLFESDSPLVVFPNPAGTVVYFRSQSPQNITLFDLTGRKIVLPALTQEGDKFKCDVSQVAEGIYVLEVSDHSQTTRTRLVISR